MKRNLDIELIKWKNSNRRKPLIIRGARQVGKTWTIKNFGDENFNRIIIVDFEKSSIFCKLFKDTIDPIDIIKGIEISLKVRIIPNETLLFFDEIQSCPRAIMALRYFYEEFPELHIIAAGSLIEFALDSISFPVGRIQYLTMYPMTFAEYLLASGNETAFEIINDEIKELPEQTHNAILAELKIYSFIGGMPESIKEYLNSGSLLHSLNVQNELITSFKDDFLKYAPFSNKLCLENVFRSVAINVGNQIKYSSLSDSFSQPTIKKAFNLLQRAQIITKIKSLKNMGIPLEAHSSDKKFKALILDIGLWQNLNGAIPDIFLKDDDLMNLYRGALAEQFVGQELIASFDNNVYYWARDSKSSNAEIDFAVSIDNIPIPIEVKSGKSGSLKSLHLVIKNYSNCNIGIVLSTRPYSKLSEQNLIFIPIYYTSNLINYLKKEIK